MGNRKTKRTKNIDDKNSISKQPYDENECMLMCDECTEWYNPTCKRCENKISDDKENKTQFNNTRDEIINELKKKGTNRTTKKNDIILKEKESLGMKVKEKGIQNQKQIKTIDNLMNDQETLKKAITNLQEVEKVIQGRNLELTEAKVESKKKGKPLAIYLIKLDKMEKETKQVKMKIIKMEKYEENHPIKITTLIMKIDSNLQIKYAWNLQKTL